MKTNIKQIVKKKIAAVLQRVKKRQIRKIIEKAQKTRVAPPPLLQNPLEKVMIIYRISDVGYKKIKPTYINNEKCLKNAVTQFPLDNHNWVVIADNVCEETYNMIKKYIPESSIQKVSIGHGAGTFRIGYQIAMKNDDDTVVYFLENDYLHRDNSAQILREGFCLGEAEYITLYDHPDKYGYNTPNPYVCGGEKTFVFLSKSVHWKITNSTTMTFAAQVKTLRKDWDVFDRWTQDNHPYDFEIFVELGQKKRKVISPLPGYSTHGEVAWLSPLTDWGSV